MLFRLLLVGVVTGLGVEPPSRAEVATWAEAGRAWVGARIDDFGGARLVAVRDRDRDASDDAAFSAVVDDMAGTFAADLARLDRPATPSRLALAFDPIAVTDFPESALVASFDYAGQGLGLSAEANAPPTGESAFAPSLVPSRIARLASALRLTRQAASAWAGVIDDAGSATALR